MTWLCSAPLEYLLRSKMVISWEVGAPFGVEKRWHQHWVTGRKRRDARDGNKFEVNNSVTRIHSEPSNLSFQRDPETIVGTCYLVN